MKNLDSLLLSSALIATFLLFIGVLNQTKDNQSHLINLYKNRITISSSK